MKNPENKNKRFGRACLIGLLLTVCAFQPGVFAGDPDADQQGGIAGTGIVAMGPVQRFGSIFVNGREYFLTEETSIKSENSAQQGEGSEVHLGDVVTIDGQFSGDGQRGVARSVTVQLALRGRVQTADVKTGTLEVLGQTVHVPADTFGQAAERVDLSRIRTGDTVAISGLARADGSWTATRVSRTTSDPTGFLLRGTVRSLDRKQGTIQIGSTLVSFPARTITAALRPGQAVRIAGRYLPGAALQGVRIDIEKPDLGRPGTRIEMSGHIQSIPAPGTAIFNGIALRFGSGTSITDGAMANIVVGMPVTIRGTVDPTGGIVVQDMVLRSEFLRVSLPRQGASGRTGAPVTRSRNSELPGADRPQIERPSIQRPDIERPNLPQR